MSLLYVSFMFWWRPGLKPSPTGTVSWPLCYCYDGSMRLEAVNNIHYRRKIRPKVKWQFYDFISYLEDVLRIEAVHNWTLITWEGPPTSELQPGEVAGRVEPNKQCLAELSGVWVLQIAANTTCLQGDYRVEDKNSRPREDIDFLKKFQIYNVLLPSSGSSKKSLRGIGAIFQFLKQASVHFLCGASSSTYPGQASNLSDLRRNPFWRKSSQPQWQGSP